MFAWSALICRLTCYSKAGPLARQRTSMSSTHLLRSRPLSTTLPESWAWFQGGCLIGADKCASGALECCLVAFSCLCLSLSRVGVSVCSVWFVVGGRVHGWLGFQPFCESSLGRGLARSLDSWGISRPALDSEWSTGVANQDSRGHACSAALCSCWLCAGGGSVKS